MRTFYRKRQKALLTAIQEVFGNTATVSGENAGMHILLTLETTLPQEELIARVEHIGIRIYSPIATYAHREDCPHSQILLGFATIPAHKCKPILEELKHAWNM